MKHAIAALTLATVLGRSLPLLACGATAPPYYVVEQQAPTSDDVPLNAPIEVMLKESQGGPVVSGFAPSLVLTKPGDDQALALKPLLGAPRLVWVPLQPLAPNTIYEAHYNPGYEGQPDSIWRFKTGAREAPTLTLAGELSVTLEAGSDPTYGSLNDCGTGVETGRIAVTKARVKLPSAVGGFARRFGQLHITDERAFDFSAPTKLGPDVNAHHLVSVVGYADLESADEIVLTLPEQEQPYLPCFAFRATDARGDEAVARPLCLERPFPAAPAGAGPSEVGNEAEHTSSSCRFGAPVGGGPEALVIALAVTALFRRLEARGALRARAQR